MLLRGQPATRQRDARRAVLLVAGVLALAPKTSCIPVATLAPVPSAAGLQGTGAQRFGNFASAAANEEGFPSRRYFPQPPTRYPFSNCAESVPEEPGTLRCCNVLIVDGMPNHSNFPCAPHLSFLVRQGTSDSASFQSPLSTPVGQQASSYGLFFSDLRWKQQTGWELAYMGCARWASGTYPSLSGQGNCTPVPVWGLGARTSPLVGDFTATDVPLVQNSVGSHKEGRCVGNRTLVQGLVIEQFENSKAFKLCEVEMLVAGVNVVPSHGRAVASKWYASSHQDYLQLHHLTDGDISTWYL